MNVGPPPRPSAFTAIALTLALAALALISLAMALAGPRLAQHVATSVHLGPTFAWTWKIAQRPLIFGLIVTALEWIYYFAPDVRHRWVWITPGSRTAMTLGLLLSLGFRGYAGHFGDYQKTYGTIGGVIVALLWLYGSGLTILIGAGTDRHHRAYVGAWSEYLSSDAFPVIVIAARFFAHKLRNLIHTAMIAFEVSSPGTWSRRDHRHGAPSEPRGSTPSLCSFARRGPAHTRSSESGAISHIPVHQRTRGGRNTGGRRPRHQAHGDASRGSSGDRSRPTSSR